MVKVHFIGSEDGDWEGMYVNGELVIQGHSIRGRQAVDALADYLLDKDIEAASLAVSEEEKPLDWFEEYGCTCPSILPEVA